MLIRSLVEVASRGGNFLLNVGPQPDGVIQPEFQERLRAIGSWLSVNGESIYGTTYGPVQGVSSIRTTAKKDKIFAHVFDWPRGPTIWLFQLWKEGCLCLPQRQQDRGAGCPQCKEA
jgi:alpha-L-fucosidase